MGNYTVEQVNRLACEVRSLLRKEDFYALYKRYQRGIPKIETYGFLNMKKREVTEWKHFEERIANLYELRRIVWKEYEYGYNGIDTSLTIFAINDEGKLISVSGRSTINTNNYQFGHVELEGDVFPENYPDNYTVSLLTETQMELFNYEFINWTHRTKKFDEWGYGSASLPVDYDIDNYNYGTYGLKPGRIFTGRNEGIYMLLQSITKQKIDSRIKFMSGPERPTFSMALPASVPVFNSIIDNPTIGDERYFVLVGEINLKKTELKKHTTVVPRKQYLVYIYFHNNASATYNDSEHNRKGVAVRTRMSSSFSSVVTPENPGSVLAKIISDNAEPESVWSGAVLTTSNTKVCLRYVDGSAKLWCDWEANGTVIPSSLFSEEGTLIGLNKLNGVIPGCEEYHGVISYVIEAI